MVLLDTRGISGTALQSDPTDLAVWPGVGQWGTIMQVEAKAPSMWDMLVPLIFLALMMGMVMMMSRMQEEGEGQS